MTLIETTPLFATTSWLHSSSHNPSAIRLFARHYSSHAEKQEIWRRCGFAGTGEKLVLITFHCDALFVWRHERYRMDNQTGVECSVFRNESSAQSSDLIKQAMTLAEIKWPGKRLFTFVDSRKISSANPGYCFKCAGWHSAGRTKKGLHILEYTPNQ